MRRPNSAEGWLRLGQACFRSREIAAAEKNLEESVRLDPQNPESLTALGLVRYQRRRVSDAAQLFNRALKEQPDYPPALLNLAIIAQQDLNDPRLALEKYRQYAALRPPPENLPAVTMIVRQIEQQLNAAAHDLPTNNSVHLTATNAPKSLVFDAGRTTNSSKSPPPTNTTHTATLAKTEPPNNLVRNPVITNTPKNQGFTNSISAENVEMVKLTAEPVIRPAEDLTSVPASAPLPQTGAPASSLSSPEAKAQKRGFFQRINPINLFTHDGKAGESTPTASDGQSSSGHSVSPPKTTDSQSGDTRKFPQYNYRSPAKPLAGDRSAAEKPFAQGVQSQQSQRFAEAIASYRQAALLDPAYFDAHYNLGLAAAQSGNLAVALAAYETALAIQPESLDARYNFGLALKQGGYVLDALTQFELVLNRYPNEPRAHLALGNLYAQQLQDPGKAREHYLAVLAVAPQSPQAGAIRYWLSDHPR
jgi:tetratricopeptide (TPR) repeat protein